MDRVRQNPSTSIIVISILEGFVLCLYRSNDVHEDESSRSDTGMSVHPKSKAREHAPFGFTLLMFGHRRRELWVRLDERAVVAVLDYLASFAEDLFGN